MSHFYDWRFLAIVLGSLLVGFGRLLVPGHDLSWPGTYEAFAHIWVGVLLTLACQKHWPSLWCLLTITLVEVVAFALR